MPLRSADAPSAVVSLQMEPSPRIGGSPPLRLLRDVVLLSRLVHRLIDPPLRRELGLSSKEVYVLRSLTLGVDRPGAIARRLNLAPPSVSRAVDVLASRGFVERHDRPDDGRATALAITEAGTQALEAALVIVHDAYDQAYGHLDPALVEGGIAVIEALLEAMNAGEPTLP